MVCSADKVVSKQSADTRQCQSSNECQKKFGVEVQGQIFQDHDVLYTTEALEREYYVF